MSDAADTPPSTVAAVYASYEAEGNKPFISPRIGAAKAGTECARALWYDFRWTTKKVFTGRMLRLFQTGHIEEARMVANLRAAGVNVLDVDPNAINEKTGQPRQWELTDATGHIVCRMDGALIGVKEAPAIWHVGEFKTHSDKSFKLLLKEGLHKSKPEHVAQCQIGMHLSGMHRAFYLARNKNTDELWSTILEYDAQYCVDLMARLEGIILAPVPPARISNNSSFFKCKFCDHAPVCNFGTLPPRSCRTCLHSQPENGAAWRCTLRDELRDRDQQREGCKSHLYIPDYIRGQQVDVIENAEGLKGISYELQDGTEWIDEGPQDA